MLSESPNTRDEPQQAPPNKKEDEIRKGHVPVCQVLIRGGFTRLYRFAA